MTHNNPSVTPFASARLLAQGITICLIVGIAVGLLALALNYLGYQLLAQLAAGQVVSETQLETSEKQQAIMGGLHGLVYLATAVLFLWWVHITYRNLPALGARHLQFSPGWAVGYFFIPFLNVVRPFRVVKEIWSASDPKHTPDFSWRTYTPASPLVGWWWGFFLAFNITTNLSTRLAPSPDSLEAGKSLADFLETYRMALGSQATTYALGVIAAILAILVVRNIDIRQEERSKYLATEGGSSDIQAGGPTAGETVS